MTEFTPGLAGRVAGVALFREWRRQVGAGDELTREGVMQIWGRLDPESGEFEPCGDLDALRRVVAAVLGIERGDRPDMEPVPDTPGGICW